jgi:hypothetical protein
VSLSVSGLSPPDKSTYIGDFVNLHHLAREFGEPFERLTHGHLRELHIRQSLSARFGKQTVDAIDRSRSEELVHIQNCGAFDMPTCSVQERLVDVFISRYLPIFPILDHRQFRHDLSPNRLSRLLLNGVYLTGSVLLDPGEQVEGFTSRYSASATFYKRAKLLYDADYETDVLTVIQSSVLMSNWWGGLLDQKDPYYWLGIAASKIQMLKHHEL